MHALEVKKISEVVDFNIVDELIERYKFKNTLEDLYDFLYLKLNVNITKIYADIEKYLSNKGYDKETVSKITYNLYGVLAK